MVRRVVRQFLFVSDCNNVLDNYYVQIMPLWESNQINKFLMIKARIENKNGI